MGFRARALRGILSGCAFDRALASLGSSRQCVRWLGMCSRADLLGGTCFAFTASRRRSRTRRRPAFDPWTRRVPCGSTPYTELRARSLSLERLPRRSGPGFPSDSTTRRCSCGCLRSGPVGRTKLQANCARRADQAVRVSSSGDLGSPKRSAATSRRPEPEAHASRKRIPPDTTNFVGARSFRGKDDIPETTLIRLKIRVREETARRAQKLC